MSVVGGWIGFKSINSVWPNRVTWRRTSYWSTLIQILTYRLFGTKPIHEPMTAYRLLDPAGQTSIETDSKFNFYCRKSWWRHQMETLSALLAICVGNSPVNSPHKGQWRGALMFSLICVCINGWVNNREAGDLRRYRAHHDVIVMIPFKIMNAKRWPFCWGLNF